MSLHRPSFVPFLFLSGKLPRLYLSFAFASLGRSSPGGDLLINAYWLLYIIDLLPLLAIATMVVLVILIAIHWRDLSDGLGLGMAGRRKKKGGGKHRLLKFLVVLYSWTFALVFLLTNCKGVLCGGTNSLSQTLHSNFLTNGSNDPSSIALRGFANSFSGIVQLGWFIPAFFGLALVSLLVIARSFLVSWRESKRAARAEISDNINAGLEAVHDAIKIISESQIADPRSRIIACYQRLVRTVSALGAPISPDQTARELEREIRRIFLLDGNGVRDLTKLFEEARYSIHPITEVQSLEAGQYLREIEEELQHRAESMSLGQPPPLIVQEASIDRSNLTFET